MSPLASLAGAYRTSRPVLANPPNGSSVSTFPVLEWDTDNSMDREGTTIHFHIQIASDSGFVTVVKEYVSWSLPASRFQYEDTPGVWVNFAGPANADGLPSAKLGKRCRCVTDFLTNGSYFWRVRNEQFV